MAYEKTEWKDQDVENPRTYSVRQNLDGTVTLLDAFGEVREIGTPVNAENLNKMEQGIYDAQRVVGDIGDIYYTLRTDVPAGGAWCDGAEYTKEAFPAVYQMLVDGKLQKTDYNTYDTCVSRKSSCGFFALDTGTQKFKVPLLKDVYIKAGQAPSMFGAESLPNIKGLGSASFSDNTIKTSGALTAVSSNVKGGGYGSVGSLGKKEYFNASRSSSTYQDSAKVNPDHVVYRAYVVLYASAAEASVAQAQEFMTALSGKANVALDNVIPTQSFKDMSIGWGMPDYNSAITLSTSQFPYTVPMNGVIYQAATNCTLYVNGAEANYNGTAGGSSCFVSKGDIVTMADSFVRCYFYPLKGAN